MPTLTVPGYQERERRLARAYRALVQCNRALVRATSEPDLLHRLCKLLVQVGDYELAWVGFAMEDAERTVRCVAKAGHSDGYLESIRVTWADEPHGRGPTGACIRRREPVVYRDTQTQPGFEPWRAQAAERGLASVIGLPIVVAGRCIGALTVYAPHVDAFDPDEEELLLRLTEDLAFGIGALRDRAEREAAEARLREREDMYRQIVKHFPKGALGLYDPDLRHVLVDGEGLVTLGQSRERLEGRTVREAFPPGLADALEPMYREAIQGRPAHAEVPFGGRWFDVTLRPIPGGDGKPARGFFSSLDVTERKQALEATAESEALFRSAFEDASAGRALESVDGRYVRVNRALCRMLGYAADELVGMRVADVTHPEDRPRTTEGIRALLAGEAATVRLAKRYVRKDGGTLFAEVGLSLARGGDASPRHFIAEVRDVSAPHPVEAGQREP